MTEDWAVVMVETSPGEVTVKLYQRKEPKQTVEYVLNMYEMVAFQEMLQHSLAYHLRMMT